MQPTSPQKIVILGHGYLPYLIALTLKIRFKNVAQTLTVIHLGEAAPGPILKTLSSMKQFHTELGLSEVEFVKQSKAEINLGFEYDGFLNQAEMVCESQYGFDLNHLKFSHVFNKLQQRFPNEKLEEYGLAARLSRLARFTPASTNPRSIYASIAYGYRLSNSAYAAFLKRELSKHQVNMCSVSDLSVNQDGDGFVQSIMTKEFGTLTGDFFIDASDTQVIKNSVQPQNKRALYLCDHALSVRYSDQTSPAHLPYSKIVRDLSALQLKGHYLKNEEIITLAPNRTLDNGAIDYQPWVDDHPWVKNCVAVGNAFINRVSVLVDNSHIHQNILLRLIELWPRTGDMSQESKLFSARAQVEVNHLIQLDLLHFAVAFNKKEWLPEAMQYKWDIYQRSGKLAFYEQELLLEAQWPVLFNALGIKPDVIDLSVQGCTDEWLMQDIFKIKSTLDKAAQAAPSYSTFIDKAHL